MQRDSAYIEYYVMMTENNQGENKPNVIFYILAALIVIVLVYTFGGLMLLVLPWLGMKALLG